MVAKKRTTKKPEDTPAQSWTEAAAKTDVPEIVISNEFHAPISESTRKNNAMNGRRLWRYILLSLLLIIAAVLLVWLTHERPVAG